MRRYLVLLAALLFVAIGFACGGGDDASGPSGGTSGGPGGTSSSGQVPGATDGGTFGGITLDDSGAPTIPPPSCPDPAAGARVFYVDGQSGDDAKDGTSEATAWKTINRAVGSKSSTGPGDTVMVKKGTYRERVHIQRPGTAQQRILLRPFGQDRVIVDASDSPGPWSLDSGQVYRSHPSFSVQAVVVDGVPMVPATSRTAMAAGQYFLSGGDLFVWTPTGADPGTRDTGVIAVDTTKTQHAFYVDASYVTVCGMTARFAAAKGFYLRGDFIRIEQNHIEHNGGIGLLAATDDNIVGTDAEIVGNEIADNFLRNWPRCIAPYKSGGWGPGVACQFSPNVKFLKNVVHDNGGEGIVIMCPKSTVQGNVVYDNWAVNVYVLNTHDVRVDGNLLFSTGPKKALLTNNNDPSPNDNHCAKQLRPIGVATGDEDLGVPDTLANVTIVNNLMVNGRYGTTHIAELPTSGMKSVTIAHNTVVVPEAADAFENVTGFQLLSNNGNNQSSKLVDNVVYAAGAGSVLFGAESGSAGFTGLTVDHNAWFHSKNAKPFQWQNEVYDHAGWVALAGPPHGAGDVLADPALVDPSTATRDPAAKCPKAGSPVVDVGVDAQVAADFFGTSRPQRAGVDLGFCELK